MKAIGSSQQFRGYVQSHTVRTHAQSHWGCSFGNSSPSICLLWCSGLDVRSHNCLQRTKLLHSCTVQKNDPPLPKAPDTVHLLNKSLTDESNWPNVSHKPAAAARELRCKFSGPYLRKIIKICMNYPSLRRMFKDIGKAQMSNIYCMIIIKNFYCYYVWSLQERDGETSV